MQSNSTRTVPPASSERCQWIFSRALRQVPSPGISVKDMRAINKEGWIKIRYAEDRLRRRLGIGEIGIHPPKVWGADMAYLSTPDRLVTSIGHEGLSALSVQDLTAGADLGLVYLSGPPTSGRLR